MKEYPFTGEVTISTEEYKDMVLKLHELDTYQRAFNSVNGQLKELEAERDRYKSLYETALREMG